MRAPVIRRVAEPVISARVNPLIIALRGFLTLPLCLPAFSASFVPLFKPLFAAPPIVHPLQFFYRFNRLLRLALDGRTDGQSAPAPAVDPRARLD